MDENQAPQLAEALQAAVPLQPANRRWTGNLKEIDSKAWDGAMDGFKSEANFARFRPAPVYRRHRRRLEQYVQVVHQVQGKNSRLLNSNFLLLVISYPILFLDGSPPNSMRFEDLPLSRNPRANISLPAQPFGLVCLSGRSWSSSHPS